MKSHERWLSQLTNNFKKMPADYEVSNTFMKNWLLILQSNEIYIVAARLRNLRSDDPLGKGHPRSIKQGLEL